MVGIAPLFIAPTHPSPLPEGEGMPTAGLKRWLRYVPPEADVSAVMHPARLGLLDQREDVAPMNRRWRSDMPKAQFAATSGVRILPIKSPSGIEDLDAIAGRDV